MKSLNNYINEEKKTTGAGCVEMIKTILYQLKNEHPDCGWDPDEEKYTGKDKDIWFSAGQFLFDYLKELNQSDLKKIVTHFGWENSIQDLNNIHPAEISLCVAQTVQK
jgi:hypothetical protein